MFRYGDKVRIQSGFYSNCIGVLIDYNNEIEPLYDVEIGIVDGRNCYRLKTITVTEKEILKDL